MRKHPLAACENCELRDRPMVPSAIPAGAKLVIVGEAPGATEVREGVPFVGDSGKLLRSTLAHIGLDPTVDVGYTNACLCRPLGNATPSDNAIECCANRLSFELQHGSTGNAPSILGALPIYTAGASATAALDLLAKVTSDASVTARVGQWYDGYGWRYMAGVHPAYILRSPGRLPLLVDSLAAAAGIDPPILFEPERVQWRVATDDNLPAVLDYLERAPDGATLAFDTETDDLQWTFTHERPATAVLGAILSYEPYKVVIIPGELLSDAKKRLERVFNRTHVVAHNGKFDQHIAWLHWMYVHITDDTMIAHHVLEETGAHGLKELATRYLRAPNYEGALVDRWFTANKIAKKDRRYSMLPREDLWKYAAYDVVCTMLLWRIFERELEREGLMDVYCKWMETAAMLYHVERNGIKVDRPYLERVQAHMTTHLADLAQHAHDVVWPYVAEREADFERLFRLMRGNRKKAAPVFNPGSDDQVSIVLYDVLRLRHTRPLIAPTSTNTGKDALDALPPNPVADVIREYRRVQKLLTTYVESELRRIDTAGYLHVDYRVTGTETGRISASNGDHGIPRPESDDVPAVKRYGQMIRAAFVADTSDHVLIDADYSQLELRIYAHCSGEPFLLEAYRNGEDVHDKTAAMLEALGTPLFKGYAEGSKQFKKDRRVVAKNTNFGNIYQGGPAGIAGMLAHRVPVSVMAQVLRYYRALMPVADAWNKAQLATLRRDGYVENIFGFRRRFPLITDNNLDEAKKAAVNAPIQGAAGMLNNLAAVELVKRGYQVAMLIHDSIVVRALRIDHAGRTAAYHAGIVKQVMEDVGNRYITSVPIVADVEVKERWERPPIDL